MTSGLNQKVCGGTTMVTKNKEGAESYTVPARIVHSLLLAVFTSIVGGAGYMWKWNLEFERWREGQTLQMKRIATEVDRGILGAADRRLAVVEYRVDENKESLNRIEDKIDDLSDHLFKKSSNQ